MRAVFAWSVIAVAAAGWALYPVDRPAKSEIAALRTQVAALTEQVSALQSRCDVAFDNAARAQDAMRAVTTPAAARPQPVQVASTAIQPLAAAAQANPTGALQGGTPVTAQPTLGEVFTEEQPDLDWASTAEATIEQKLSAQLPTSSRIQSVECHSSMCRIETVHSNRASYQDALVSATKDPSRMVWPGEMSSEEIARPESTDVLVVTYLSREGKSLPTL